MRLTIRIRGVAQDGSRLSIRHVLKPKIIRADGNEFGVEERLADTFGSLTMPADRSDERSISSQLEAAAYQSRSASKVRVVIFSFEDTLDPVRRDSQVRVLPGIVRYFQERFAPGARYWAGTHIDRNHVHCHAFFANWSPHTATSLNWSKRDVAYMLSMRWVPVGLDVRPGAYSAPERSARVYTRTAACLDLVTKLGDDPESALRALRIEKYCTKAGTAGLIFQGKKITVKNLNHELRKAGKATGLDAMYRNCDLALDTTDELTQETRIDLSLGLQKMTLADYDRFCDLPDPFLLCKTMEERDSVRLFQETGKITNPRMAGILSRLARTAIQRRILGATEPLGAEPVWVYREPNDWTEVMVQLLSAILDLMLAVIPACEIQTELLLLRGGMRRTGHDVDMDHVL